MQTRLECKKMNARTVPEELRSRRGWTETGESIQRGYGLLADRVQESQTGYTPRKQQRTHQ